MFRFAKETFVEANLNALKSKVHFAPGAFRGNITTGCLGIRP